MQETYAEDIVKVLKNKNKLEKQLGIKLTNKGKNIFIEGDAENEFTALEVLKAIDLGFSVPKALLLTQESIILQSLNIKDITKRHDLERVRARIIGTRGRALKNLTNLTNCAISLHNNKIGVIGNAEEIEEAIQAITSLVQGSKHGNVYARTERIRKRKRQEDKNLNIKNELR